MIKIHFKMFISEKILFFCCMGLGLSFLKLFSFYEAISGENTEILYQLRFLIYTICFGLCIFIIIKNKKFFSMQIDGEVIKIKYPLILKNIAINLNEICGIKITQRNMKIYYRQNNKNNILLVPLKACGKMQENDYEYLETLFDGIKIKHTEKGDNSIFKFFPFILLNVINISLFLVIGRNIAYILLFYFIGFIDILVE